MKEYVERIIPSQCRIIDNKSGFIHIEGESAIFDMNGVHRDSRINNRFYQRKLHRCCN